MRNMLAAAWMLLVLPIAAHGAEIAAGDTEGVETAARYALANGAAAVVVLRGEETILARYADDFDPEKLQMLFSGSKSFACVIAAAAVDDGLIDLDAPVERYIDEWRGTGRSAVTIRSLLSLSSGLDPARSSRRDSSQTTAQTVIAALDANIVAPPGRRFGYGPYPFLIFSEVIRRVTGREAADYLADRVLEPISVRAQWLSTADDHPHLADGALMTPRDWLTYGKLMRDGGRWRDATIIRDTTLAQCFKPSPSNRNYGLGWWLDSHGASCRRGTGDVSGVERPCVVSALGRFSNALHVLPDAGLVVLVLGRTRNETKEVSHDRLLRLILAGQKG